MADFSCDTLTVAQTNGTLKFAGTGLPADTGYGIDRDTGNQLHFQGGSAG